MQPAPVVVPLNELLDPRGKMLHIPIVVCVDLFSLQRFQKTFATGIVMRVSWPTHARHYMVLAKHLQVHLAGILHTTIRVVNESWRRLPAQNRLS